MSPGAVERTVLTTLSQSARLRAVRSSAMTLPSAASATANSRPSWPRTPVTRIVGDCVTSRIGFGCGKRRSRGIARCDDGRTRDRPRNAQRGIAPEQCALMLRIPVVGRLVYEVSGLRHDDESMRETGRYPQHFLVFGRKLDRDMLAKRR